MSKALNTILASILAEDDFENVSPVLLTKWGCTLPGERPLIVILLKKYSGGGGAVGPGTGDVEGPGSSTANALARFSGTGGKTIKNSTVTLDDSGNMNFPTNSAIRTGTTATNNFSLRAYDVDGATYRAFITLTAGNTPTMAISAPAGGSATMDGVVIGASVPAAATFTDTTVGGLFHVQSNNTTLARFENNSGFSVFIKSNGLVTEDIDIEVPDGSGVLSVKVEAPTATTDPGFEGAWAEDTDYIYVWCAAVSEWRRTSLAGW